MIIGGVTLTAGAGARIGEAARADGARTTGCGKPLERTMVTITGVRGAMTICGVSTIVACGTKPVGATNTRGVTMPECTDLPKLVLKNTPLWGAPINGGTGAPTPKPKKARPRAAALVANNSTPERLIARINP